VSADGTWEITVKSPLGAQASTVVLATDGATLTGEQTGQGETGPIYDGVVDGDSVSWWVNVTKPMPLKIEFTATIDGDTISGKAKAGGFPAMSFSGSRVG
jgi:hypothetical protein